MVVADLDTMLMSRPLLGWPDIEVELHREPTEGKHLIVMVREPGEVPYTMETTDGRVALDMFYHPFAFGYEKD